MTRVVPAAVLFAVGLLAGVVYGVWSTRPPAPEIAATDFDMLPPGSPLPPGAACAGRVASEWEPVPANHEQNTTVPAQLDVPPWQGFDAQAEAFVDRIDGDFAGTTDEILQWGACKWGIDAELVRAMAFQESEWRMDAQGDEERDPSLCPPGFEAPCPTSFGLLQIKWYHHPGTFPHSMEASAFNVDYALGHLRACFEGWAYHGSDYRAGDLWGCVGAHYSGDWRSEAAHRYIGDVRRHVVQRPWLAWLAGTYRHVVTSG